MPPEDSVLDAALKALRGPKVGWGDASRDRYNAWYKDHARVGELNDYATWKARRSALKELWKQGRPLILPPHLADDSPSEPDADPKYANLNEALAALDGPPIPWGARSGDLQDAYAAWPVRGHRDYQNWWTSRRKLYREWLTGNFPAASPTPTTDSDLSWIPPMPGEEN